METLFRLDRENVARHARWFATFAPRARSVEISGGHDLFLSNPGEVVQQLDAFVRGISR